mmetsp:Transcript_61421/g.146418  ORF Transcript_61421/g.146418 Transcript_61421/m.146418 type:complete len:222 (+) Transcript_61421:756-1421(+)
MQTSRRKMRTRMLPQRHTPMTKTLRLMKAVTRHPSLDEQAVSKWRQSRCKMVRHPQQDLRLLRIHQVQASCRHTGLRRRPALASQSWCQSQMERPRRHQSQLKKRLLRRQQCLNRCLRILKKGKEATLMPLHLLLPLQMWMRQRLKKVHLKLVRQLSKRRAPHLPKNLKALCRLSPRRTRMKNSSHKNPPQWTRLLMEMMVLEKGRNPSRDRRKLQIKKMD